MLTIQILVPCNNMLFIFIQHAVSYGNIWPQSLREVETSLWHLICSLAAGHDFNMELALFMEKLHNVNMDDDDVCPEWFIQGKLSF